MRKETLKKHYVLFCFTVLLICCLVGCGKRNTPTDKWPDSGISTVLPIPDSNKISIGFDLQDTFSADILDASKEDFNTYVVKCEECGFTIDSKSDSDDYSAYNKDGYRLKISYYDYQKQVSISLSAPKLNGKLSWPTIGLATLIPTPNTDIGTISIDSSIQFNAYVGETSQEDYNTYVEKCIENGFKVDYDKGETFFTAYNTDGISLHLEYQGFNTMYISMYIPEEARNIEENAETESVADTAEASKEEVETTTEITPEPEQDQPIIATSEPEQNQSTEESSNSSDGIRPEFKEALDSYETLMNDYCDFMTKYTASPTDLGLLAEYADYLSKYTEAMEKLDAIDESKLSDAELKYYLEVTGRVTQKLSNVAIQ